VTNRVCQRAGFFRKFHHTFVTRVYPADMDNADTARENSQPLTRRQAALADIAKRRRKDPNWTPGTDPTYFGPYPTFVPLMSDGEFDRHMAEKVKRGQASPNSCAPSAVEEALPQTMPRKVIRASLPLGQRIRDLRRAQGWTQRNIAMQLGVSARSIIRYEQGRSAPLQSAPLLALRRLESAYATELDADGARP
jgi:DNA-binding XRE family transcriptional regulator